MSSLGYDEALVQKLKYWTQDTSITITSPDETRRLFEYQADINNDKPIQLPLIALRRKPSIDIQSLNKKPLTFDGWRQQGNENKISQLNGIPIQLGYTIDIYTRHADEALDYVRSFIFNIINFPKLTIEIPYNDSKLTHNANIRLESPVTDNSDIPERLMPGQFSRWTISINIDDAYLFDYRTKDTLKIVVDSVDAKLQSEKDD